jgi:hypothetical protein
MGASCAVCDEAECRQKLGDCEWKDEYREYVNSECVERGF